MTLLTLELLAVHQTVLNLRAPLKHRSLGPPPPLQGRQMAQVEPVFTRDHHMSWHPMNQSYKDIIAGCYFSPGARKKRADTTGTWERRPSCCALYWGMWRDVHQQALRKLVRSKNRCLKPTSQQKLGMTILQNELPSRYTISYSNPNSPFRHINSPELKCPSLSVKAFSL